MHNNNLPARVREGVSKANRAVTSLAVAGSALLASGAAFAQESGGGFDGSSVVAKIQEYAATGVMIVGAFILGLWGLKAMGLLKRG